MVQRQTLNEQARHIQLVTTAGAEVQHNVLARIAWASHSATPMRGLSNSAARRRIKRSEGAPQVGERDARQQGTTAVMQEDRIR